MIYDEYTELKKGDTCVIIKTGEPGVVLAINRERDSILLKAKRVGIGIKTEWFNYTYLAKL